MAEGPLRRLGGGRWQSRDGRFTVEPQSGTWVIVDGEQVDDLGLPLVRGPFRSLAEAREAIEEARQAGPTTSPLSARVGEARREGTRSPDGARRQRVAQGDRGREPEVRSGKGLTSHATAKPPRRAERKAPAEPAWFAELDVAGKDRARRLIRALEKLGVEDAVPIARAELADGQPALARVAIARRLRATIEASGGGPELAQAIVDILVGGRDHELGASWRIVDGEDRPIRSLDLTS